MALDSSTSLSKLCGTVFDHHIARKNTVQSNPLPTIARTWVFEDLLGLLKVSESCILILEMERYRHAYAEHVVGERKR